MAGDINGVEIFATGVWNGNRKVTVTEKTLEDMINSFHELSAQVDGYRPFLKLGHKEMQDFGGESGAPSFGFISKLWREGNKILANFSNVPDALVDLINTGRYNAVSVEILPEVTFAGSKFRNVLRAVALLGAELPAVKTLKGLSASLMSDDVYKFEESSDVETLEKELEMSNEPAKFDQAQVDALIAAALTKAEDEAKTALSDATDVLQTEIDTLKGQNEELVTAKATADASLKDYVLASDKAEVEAMLDKAIEEGKIVPAERESYLALANVEATVQLSDDEKTSPKKLVESILSGKSVKVNLSEQTSNDDPSKDDADGSAGDVVNARTRDLMNASDDLDYKTAMNEVLASDEDLKTRYFKQED